MDMEKAREIRAKADVGKGTGFMLVDSPTWAEIVDFLFAELEHCPDEWKRGFEVGFEEGSNV